MVTVSDLLDIIWDVTKLDVRAYDNNRLQHEWIIGENVEETIYQWHQRKNGELSIIDLKINKHGDVIRKNGLHESGWGANKDNIPSEILLAQVWHMLLSGRLHKEPWDDPGKELSVSVNMDAMTVEMLKSKLAEIVRPLEGYEDEKKDNESNPDEQQV